MPDILLDVQGLETTFKTPEGVIHAVNGVSFGLKEGETLGVVGESGCGKSVTMLSTLRLIPSPPGKVVAGKAFFFGRDLLQLSNEEIRHVRGAQVYWLSCLPCHGDFGQGLTDEFRQVYPPEDRNCWASGCHGERPYENGFKLPAGIPALVGADTLQKFPNAAVLQAYTKATMPYWKPGSLSDEDAWAVTAFLLRENGLWNARTELNVSNADQAPVRALEAESTPEPPPSASPSATWIRLILILAGALMLFILLRQIRSRKNPRV